MSGVHRQCRLAKAWRADYQATRVVPGPLAASERVSAVYKWPACVARPVKSAMSEGSCGGASGPVRGSARGRWRQSHRFRCQGIRRARQAAGHARAWSLAVGRAASAFLIGIHRVACQDLPVDIAQFGPWFDAEFIDECPACLPVGIQGLRPPAGLGQRKHELGVEPFLQRVPGRHLQQLREQFLMVPQPEPRIEAVLEHLEAQPLKARDELAAQNLRGHVQQRGCPPQPQCPRSRGRRFRPLACPQRCLVSRHSASNSRTSSSVRSARIR